MFQRFTSPFREFGVLPGLLYAMDRALLTMSSDFRLRVYELMVQPILHRPLLPARFTGHLKIREIKRGDPALALIPARPDIVDSRFDQDAICLGAFREGEFVGYIWLCFGAYEEDEVRCTFVLPDGNEAVFAFDLYIFPQHRMSVAFAGIWDGANQFLRGRGIKFTFSRLTRFNVASRRAHQHLGWKLVGRAVFFQARGLELMAATVFPYVHLTLGRSGRARLELRPDVLLR